jgi:hypothetical protein
MLPYNNLLLRDEGRMCILMYIMLVHARGRMPFVVYNVGSCSEDELGPFQIYFVLYIAA